MGLDITNHIFQTFLKRQSRFSIADQVCTSLNDVKSLQTFVCVYVWVLESENRCADLVTVEKEGACAKTSLAPAKLCSCLRVQASIHPQALITV